MSINYGTALINGQLVPVPEEQSFNPLSYGNSLSGPGFWPAGSQYNVPPLLPSAAANSGMAAYSPNFGEGGGGPEAPIPTAGKLNTTTGRVNWLHPTKSPVVWTIGLLGLALFMLHKIHYK